MLFAESSDLVQIVTAFISFMGTALVAYLAYLTMKLKEESSELKKQGAEVNKKLEGVSTQVEVIKKATDGMATAMGEARLAQGTAEGKAVGIAQGVAEGVTVGLAQGKAERPPATEEGASPTLSGPVDITIKGEADITPGKTENK